MQVFSGKQEVGRGAYSFIDEVMEENRKRQENRLLYLGSDAFWKSIESAEQLPAQSTT